MIVNTLNVAGSWLIVRVKMSSDKTAMSANIPILSVFVFSANSAYAFVFVYAITAAQHLYFPLDLVDYWLLRIDVLLPKHLTNCT